MYLPNNPQLRSWVEVSSDSHFPIQNIPFGVFRRAGISPRLGTRIGDLVLDLAQVAQAGYFDDIQFDTSVFAREFINDFMALGKAITGAVRQRISELLQSESHYDLRHQATKFLIPISEVEMLLPVNVGDYTDFYSSIEHATNVGTMFRNPENALFPNWRHLPVGYHGRASSIVVSGTPVRRPMGQSVPNDAETPVFGASKLLDFELEMAFVIGKNNPLGNRISTQDAEDYIFGFTLFNDWSARDIQKWEYVPLGPFLAKSFTSSVSPWIVTLEALAPFRVPTPRQMPAVLPYLEFEGDKNFDIALQVQLQPPHSEAQTVCESNYKYLYWNINQQLAHHTVNGCNLRVGDMCASGTISGSTPDSFGSMLELTWKGTKPIRMPDGSERKFIQDFDTVTMTAYAEKDGVRVGFGEVTGQILPAE